MDDVKCPKCRAELRTCHRALGHEAVCVDACGFVGPMLPEPGMALAACERLCYLDERPRLPTKKQEDAHRARHGAGAGFFVQSTDRKSPASYRTPTWMPLSDSDLMATLKSMTDRGLYDLTCWPADAAGRPVAGPEGW